jgi:hypothetical protein
MHTNKFYKFVIFVALVSVFGFIHVSLVGAESIGSLPDNVKITSSPDGLSTTVVMTSKPGFTTNVKTNCVNGKCTHTATSTALTNTDIKKMQDDIKKQQEAMNKFWKMQNEMFKQQQQMFKDLWGVNLF